MRILLATLLLTVFATAAIAQEVKESVPPTTPRPHEDETRIIFELEVSPADEPRPAMKYQLLPNPADLQPGNAATQYYKAFVLEADNPVRTKAYAKLREELGVPLSKINIDELGKTLESLHEDVFYSSIRAATFRLNCHWGEPLEGQGVHLLVPAVSQMRSTGVLLAVKAKYEIGRGDHDAAFATARDAFTLAFHMQEDGQLVIQTLVGIAINGLLHEDFFLEWIRSPNSPNLYWALAEIPPYFDSRSLIAHELRMAEYTLPGLVELDRRALTVDEANDLAARISAGVGTTVRKPLQANDVERRIQLMSWALQAYGEGYGELRNSGYAKELLESMPVLQVGLLARWKRFQGVRDDQYKWWLLMYGPDRDLALRQEPSYAFQRIDRLPFALREPRGEIAPFDEFLPFLSGLYRAQLRQYRFLSVARAIEALRLHAARHGKLPDSLDDIRDVPVPNDPVTNAPFVYRMQGTSATLIMPRHDLGADLEWEYQLRLREGEPK